MTLACIDANLILVEAVTVADVDDENCVGNSLLQIGRLVLKLHFCSDFKPSQGLQSKFRQDFEAGVCSAFCR